MWETCFFGSVGMVLLAVIYAITVGKTQFALKPKLKLFQLLFASVALATILIFLPVRASDAAVSILNVGRAFLLSIFNTMQVFAVGCDFEIVTSGMSSCPAWLNAEYQAWTSVLFVLAPAFTFGFVLSLFNNLSAHLKLFCSYFKDLYVFSELNEKSLTLARDIKEHNKKVAIVFTDVFEDNEEKIYELLEEAKKIGAICFKKDILLIDFKKRSPKSSISFFAIGEKETENLNQSLKLIENYSTRDKVNLYVFSTKIESELLLADIDRGKIKVRRINEVQSLVNRLFYEQGKILFESAKPMPDGTKRISAVVVGMGSHGTEMVKALAWYGQMDGYTLEINAFDKDKLAEEKFVALAPELMSPIYNGVIVEGEAQYTITIHPKIDVETMAFAKEISKIKDATYVMVALGNDDANISTAVRLRMYFERMKIHPVIQAIVYNSQQKKALCGVKNFRGQPYDITFVGDMESSYTEDVIIDSELEDEALRRHLKWGKEEEFWAYEYNYRSSVASAIHMKARIACGIPGAAKKETELTAEERDVIESLEHRRWNAYMRAEGYVFSGSGDKSSRNDLAKMHHDLVDYASLTDDEKRKDSKIGTD